MRVTFLHPDLGIGGAERLVVDAAVALQRKGHTVKVITNQYDPSHAFKETQDLEITVIQWFPRLIFGYMWALCAYVRMCLAAIYVAFCVESDVIICDQVSAALLVLKLFSKSRLVFYCHFPDMLLTTRKSLIKSIYRYFLDSIEEFSTGQADVICVNSLFTASVVKETFKSLQHRELKVLYPTLNTQFFDDSEDCAIEEIPLSAEHVFTSLNRFEVKKNVKLAIEAFAALRSMLSAHEFSSCHLVVAGGYDRLNSENITHFKELVQCVEDLGLDNSQVTFLRSPSDQEKISLLRRSRAILYTPHNEHFGIVPIEAMYCGTPVIAVNSGGPTESIVHKETGFLSEQIPEEFAKYMLALVRDEELRKTMADKMSKAFIGKPAPEFVTKAVYDGDFKDVKLSDYKGKYVVLFFYPLDFTFVCPTEIIAFSDRFEEFKKIDVAVLACSTDSVFSHLAWINTPRKHGGLGDMKIPVLADTNHQIAKDYGVLKEDEGIAYRGLFIIDPKGILRQITVNDLPVGRSVDETLRLVQAFQFVDKHGEVCPAGWTPGKDTIKPGVKDSKEYFSKANK